MSIQAGSALRTRLLGVARAGLAGVVDVLLPPNCLACDRAVDAPGRLCTACFRALTFLGPPCCDRCGQGFVHVGRGIRGAGGGLLCARCAVQPPPWGRARAAVLYDAGSRRLLLGFKHADRVEQATPLAAFMARAGAQLLRNADVLVPVPLHRHRLLARRYNQAALLAQALGRLARVPVLVDGLRRVRPTASLGHLGPFARAEAVRAAIAVPPSRLAPLAGRRVLLVDDVLTTGATAGACAEALIEAGAVHVDVLVAARAGRLE